MKIPLLVVFVALLSACSAPPWKREGGAVPARSSPPWDPAPPAAVVQTPGQKRNADAATDKYFKGMIRTLTEIDDRKTSPEIVAKAALSANLRLLRERIRAEGAHIAAVSEPVAVALQQRLRRTPTAADVFDATYMVIWTREEKPTPLPNPSSIPPRLL